MGGKSSKQSEGKWLDHSNSGLEQIPEVASRNIKGMNLSGNLLKLPDDFGLQLSCLEYLNMSNCELTSLPRSISRMSNLKELLLVRNSLSNLPRLPNSLQKLDVSYNFIVRAPDQFSRMPNLFHLVLRGNPCEKDTVILKGKSKRALMERVRINDSEMDSLTLQFHSFAREGIIDREIFRKRLGMEEVPDTTFVDALYRVFEQYSTTKNGIDFEGFLIGLGIIFKGTVRERMQFVFDIFNEKMQAGLKLEDVLLISKSSLISSLYLARVTREEYSLNSTTLVSAQQLKSAIHSNGRRISDVTTSGLLSQEVIESMIQSHWPPMKESLTKSFKSIANGNTIEWGVFKKHWFTKFDDICEFLEFYGLLLAYGYQWD